MNRLPLDNATCCILGFKKWGILQENALPYWDECTFCLRDFYDVSMCDISVIIKSLAWSVHNDKVIASELDKIDMIKELLHVKFGQWTLFFCTLTVLTLHCY